jgi:tetratricopeptide (TPR) repeat protein
MRSCFLFLLVGATVLWAQTSSTPSHSAPSSSSQNSQAADAAANRNQLPQNPTPQNQPSENQSPKASNPNLTPPRSDSVSANALDDTPGESSSQDNPVDLSPPKDDAKAHRDSSTLVTDTGSGDTPANEVRPWDPHKATKDIEVGDFYFRQKNYIGAESRYREALYYKNNDAIATYQLGVCLEKMNRPDEALEEYEAYLRILPDGPKAGKAKKAIERLTSAADSKQ